MEEEAVMLLLKGSFRLLRSFPEVNNDSQVKEIFMSFHILNCSYKYCKSVVKLQMVRK